MAKAQKSQLLGELGAASLGLALGGVLGMLFSPNSGKKNRQIIAKQAGKAKRTAMKAVKTAEKKVVRKATVRKTVVRKAVSSARPARKTTRAKAASRR